jgi:hypothetical protein
MQQGILTTMVCLIFLVAGVSVFGLGDDGFHIFGRNGGFTLFCAALWFINTLFFMWAMWHTFLGNYGAKQLAIITFIIGILLFIAVDFSNDVQSGERKRKCNNEFYIQKFENGNGTQRLEYCPYEFIVMPDMIGKIVVCPKCGNSKRVEKTWW